MGSAEGERNRCATYCIVVELFIARHAKRNKTWRDTQAVFALHVIPYWGNRLITEITRADVARLLDLVEDRTSVYRTNRVLAAVRKLFNWAVARGTIQKSPVVPGMARQGEKSRDRYLTPSEIRLIWSSATKLGYPAGTLIQLLLLTGQRRSEVAGMRMGPIGFGPREGLAHSPLANQSWPRALRTSFGLAIHLIQSAPKLGDYVLSTGGETPISGFSKWKKRLDEEVAASVADLSTIPPLPSWRLHDLRRTVATHMEELGIPHTWSDPSSMMTRRQTREVTLYTRGNLLYERRKALTTWARFLTYVLDRTSVGRLERILSGRRRKLRLQIRTSSDPLYSQATTVGSAFLGRGKQPAQSGHA